MTRLGGFYYPLHGAAGQAEVLKQFDVQDVLISAKSPLAAAPRLPERFPIEDSCSPDFGFTTEELRGIRLEVEASGFRLASFENPMVPWAYDEIQLGGPGKQQQLDNFCALIRRLRDAGIDMFGIHWMVRSRGDMRASFRMPDSLTIRSGAQVRYFDAEHVPTDLRFRPTEISRTEALANLWDFLHAVSPVLDECGIRMAIHPDDPAIPLLGGTHGLFGSPRDFEEALNVAASDNVGLNFCLGNWTAMGVDLQEAITQFGGSGRIFYGHAQGFIGTATAFREGFLDEADCDFARVFVALEEVGFDGVIAPAHLPQLVTDDDHQTQATAFALGYLKGQLELAQPRRTAWPLGGIPRAIRANDAMED